MKRLIASITLMSLVSSFCISPVLAAGPLPFSFSGDMQAPGGSSEYIYRNDPDEALVPIYLVGAVAKPGLYHVPANTDLIRLIALSGGMTSNARLNDISIRSKSNESSFKYSEVNFQQLMDGGDSKQAPYLKTNDVVYVHSFDPVISSNTLITVGLISSVFSIILAAIVINQSLKNK